MKPDQDVRPAPFAPLAGVRTTRGGPVLFCDPSGQELIVGQIVVIVATADDEKSGQPPGGLALREEALATVIFTPDELLENAAGASTSARVVRLATHDDVTLFGRQAAQALGFAERAKTILAETDPGSRVVDVRLSPDRARLAVIVESLGSDAVAVARSLERALGLPVDLRLVAPDATEGRETIEAAGVFAAGLPPGWTDWLAEPGVEPTVRQLEPAHGVTAREFIDRLFPPEERAAWERPRRA